MARATATLTEPEALPEADVLSGFPHPRQTAKIFGHAETEQHLSAALADDRMHHAWLLAGAYGIGKATMAYRVAAALLAREDERGMFASGLDVEQDCPTWRQIRACAHPGLLVIRRTWDAKAKRFSASIPVDEVRRLRSFLALSAEAGGRRVVIVDSADELNLNAANALLKSLEEPPPRTVFLIVTSMPGRLLATIRSRCRVLTFGPLGSAALEPAVRAAMAAAGKTERPDVDWEDLTAVADGSVRRALEMIEAGGLGLQARIDKILSGLPTLDGRAVHGLADELQGAAAEPKFLLFYDLLQATLARMIGAEARGTGRPADLALASRLIGPSRLASFAELWETLARDKAEVLALNLDRKALVLATFARLEAASRS